MSFNLGIEIKITFFLGGINGEMLLKNILKKLEKNFKIERVFVIKDYNSIKKICYKNKIQFDIVNDIKSFVFNLKTDQNSVLACCGFQSKIPNEIIYKFNYKAINVHNAILPDYRGIHGFNWALINMEDKLGSTCHYLNDKIDCGNILHISTFENKIEYTADLIYKKLFEASYVAFKKGINNLLNSKNGLKQPKEIKTWPRRFPRDSFFVPKDINLNTFMHFHRALCRPGIFPFFYSHDLKFIIEEYSLKKNKSIKNDLKLKDGIIYLTKFKKVKIEN